MVPQDLRPERALARLEMGAHSCMEATLVQERRSIARTTSSQVFPDPNRNMMGRLTHHVRSSIRCAFRDVRDRPGRSDGGMMARVFGGGDKFKLVIPDGARSAQIGDLVPSARLERGPGSALRAAWDDEGVVGATSSTERAAQPSGNQNHAARRAPAFQVCVRLRGVFKRIAGRFGDLDGA